MQKDFSHQPDKLILRWLLQCRDIEASSQKLESKESRQLESLARDKAIDKGTGKKAEVLSLWQWLLSSVKDRYSFKEEHTNSWSKQMIVEGGIQYPRELAVLEVICNDLDNNQTSKDLDEIQCMQSICLKFVEIYPCHTLTPW